MTNEYYVYLYLREDGTPYYVGKGKGNRAYQQHRNVHVPKTDDRIIFAHTNLYEDDALEKESELILQYGRKDIKTGILENRKSGGGGHRNSILTETQVQELRQKRKKFILIKDLMKHYGLSKATIYRVLNDGVVHAKSESRQLDGILLAKRNGVKFGRKKAFTETQVQELRQKRREGHLIKDLMNQYSMARATICRYLGSTRVLADGLNKPEVLAKISATVKEKWKDPEYRLKASTSMRESWARKKAEKLQESAN